VGRSSCWGFFLSGFWFGFAVLEAEAVIAGLDDVAMMGVNRPGFVGGFLV